ncbi:hypothetical protein ALQ63_00794 [Serratia plymuthica]|uniref:Exotoxin n=1 Tax=Serratia plymuthica TaxID=82996 RepID=A0A318NT41_SERPL|nr:fimbrial protein [Serratia plymuthica]AGO57464.1 hypothetical protein SOD_c45210 [Serratia plymuthica 4Rx13]PYD36980.1 exotoxin [Serratia plymuthica]RMN21240.1 hypothetical protein ALQ63_00794 [Serratia plymuthica]
MSNSLYICLLVGWLFAASVPPVAAASNNLKLHGALVAEPCTLSPGDENVQLDFGTTIDKYLYLNGRTNSKAFQLHLIDCDITLGKTLRITFNGTENSKLPGLLALDGSSQANGVAIGMENPQGQPLPLNRKTGIYTLTDGNNVINLLAYVRGEPEAISNKSIGRGTFTAITTFSLEYE